MGDIIKPIIKPIKKLIGGIVNLVTGFLGMFGMSFDTPDFAGGADYEAQQQGITVNKQSNVAGIPVVYGRRNLPAHQAQTTNICMCVWQWQKVKSMHSKA